MTAQVVAGLDDLGAAARAEAQLASSANRALREVMSDLQRSGFATIDGLEYPHLFLDGEPSPNFADHAHTPATPLDDYGGDGSREVIYRLPSDADNDGVPDLDGNGDLVWDPREFSYVLVTGADGINVLQRRIDGADPRVIARNVDRIVVDNAITSGFEIGLDVLRVTVDMVGPGTDDNSHRMTSQGLVRIRNGGQLQ